MEHAMRIKAFALGCALLVGGALAADHLSGAPAGAEADAPLAAQECTARTPVDTTRYFGTAPGAPWDSVRAYMRSARIDFDIGSPTTLPVRLCAEPGKASCRTFVLTISSEASNICLTGNEAQDGKLRMLGLLETPGQAVPDSIGARWGFTAANASQEVYLLLRGTTAYAMYDSAGVTAFTPTGNWKWSFCPHLAPPKPYAEARWRSMPATDTVPPCSPDAEHASEHANFAFTPGEELTSYGWMACVSGCCRFYGSPPSDPDEEEEEEEERPRPDPRPRPRPRPRP